MFAQLAQNSHIVRRGRVGHLLFTKTRIAKQETRTHGSCRASDTPGRAWEGFPAVLEAPFPLEQFNDLL
eukprot:5750789-Pyramimonas_sp.AAC.1